MSETKRSISSLAGNPLADLEARNTAARNAEKINELGEEIEKIKENGGGNPADAPVKSVNGKTGDVKLSAADVGARPADWTPTAGEVGADAKGSAAAEGAKALKDANAYTDQQISGIPTPDVSGQIGQHNAEEAAHPYIRDLIAGLTARLNALADSDDTTLDQLSEIVAYIKSNKSLIDAITTSKVSVSDIINNLTTSAAAKPLSAAQGVVLKTMIEAITVPTALSQLTSDTAHRTVTDAEKAAWDAKSEFSGAYADLTGKPTIPTVPAKLSAFENDKGYLTQHQDISHKLDAAKLPEAVNDALAQAKASGEFDGEDGVSPTVTVSKADKVTTVKIADANSTKTATINDGADGVSATHSWSGTTLTITSASGTSSADLKGDKGDKPEKGVDYYTAADKTEMVNAVLAALPTWTGGSY